MAKGANGGEVRARLTLDNSQFKRNAAESRQQMEGLDKTAKSSAESFKMLENAAKITGLAVAGIAAASVVTAAQFEQSMARVAAISGATGDEFEALNVAAKEAGATTVFSSTEAADALSYLAMAGFDVNQQVAALPDVLNLAAAAQVDLGQSADIVSNIMTGFGIEADDAGMAVDVLVEAMTSANTNLPQLGEAMKYVAPVANGLGWSIEETATAIAKMSDAGIQGSQAGTSLRAMLISLSNPIGQTAKAVEDLGLELYDTNGNLKPLPELVGEVSGKLEGMSETQQTATASMLVGREAASGFLAILQQSPEDLQAYIDGLENSTGRAEELAAVQNDTLIGSFKEFTSAVEAVAIEVGEEFLPELRAVVDTGTDIVRWVGDINPRLIELGLKFAGGASAAILLVGALSKLRAGLKMLQLMSGPLGWLSLAAGLLGGVATATLLASDSTEKLQTVNLENIKTMHEEERALDGKLDRYEELRGKTEDANGVLGTYLDLQKQINATSDPEKLEKLGDAQATLAEKAGLTVDELDEMARLNGEFVANNPEIISAYSEQGEAIAGNTEQLRNLQKEMLQNMTLELNQEMAKATDNVENLLSQYEQFFDDYNKQSEIINEAHEIQEQATARLEDAQKGLTKAKEDGNLTQIEGYTQMVTHETELIGKQDDRIAKAYETQDAMQGENEELIEQIQNTRQIFDEAINVQLAMAGINEEGDRGVAILEETLSKEAARLLELEGIRTSQGSLNEEQRAEYEQLSENLQQHGLIKDRIDGIIDSQTTVNTKIDDATGKSRDMVDILTAPYTMDVDGLDDPLDLAREISGELDKGHNKNVEIFETGLDKLIDQASKEESKTINFQESGLASINERASSPITRVMRFNVLGLGGVSGTRHMGGPTYDLPKYHIGGVVEKPRDQMMNAISKVTAPKANEVDVRLLRNEMVLTQAQQSNLFRMVDDYARIRSSQAAMMQALATGASNNSGEGNSQPIVLQVNLDGRQIAESTFRDTSELLERQARQRKRNVRGR